MNPYLGATVLVNVDAAHNDGQPVAPAIITRVLPSGRVNVHVLYDAAEPRLGHHRHEYLTDLAFHDTTDPAVANRQGLYGVFWPDGSMQAQLNLIIKQQGEIMAAQDDINAAVSAIQAVTADLTSAASNIQTEVANLNSQLAAAGSATVDTTALNAAIAPLQAAQAAVDALETPAPAPAAPAEPAAPEAPAAS